MLGLGLFLAQELLGAPLPQSVDLEVRKDPMVGLLAERVYLKLFGSGEDRTGFSDAWFHLRVRERLRDGLRYSLSLALAPTLADWAMLALPARLSFLYYPARFIRLMGKYRPRIRRSAARASS